MKVNVTLHWAAASGAALAAHHMDKRIVTPELLTVSLHLQFLTHI